MARRTDIYMNRAYCCALCLQYDTALTSPNHKTLIVMERRIKSSVKSAPQAPSRNRLNARAHQLLGDGSNKKKKEKVVIKSSLQINQNAPICSRQSELRQIKSSCILDYRAIVVTPLPIRSEAAWHRAPVWLLKRRSRTTLLGTSIHHAAIG